MKRVCFIIMSYSRGGGAESLLTNIVNRLNPDKYAISVIEIVHDDIKIEPVNSNIKILPYIMRTDDPERKRKMYYLYHEPEKVFRKFIGDKYDLYVSFNYQRPSFLLPPGRKNIAWIHGDIYNLMDQDKEEERALQNNAFKNATRIVAISDITYQSIVDVCPGHEAKIVELYNGVDIDMVRKKSNDYTDINLEHPAVLFIGRLEENKNPLGLLRAWQILHDVEPEVHLYYLGYGPQIEDVKKMVESTGLSKYVHMLGYKENPFPIMKQCDVSVLLSKSEGFPMCLLESQALLRPIVSTHIGGSKILLQDANCGRVVSSEQEAAEAMRCLLHKNPHEVHVACEKSIKRFNMESYIGKIEKLFDDVLRL